MELKHLELFAGIGGFRKAIDLLSKDFGFKAKCIGFSEKDAYAIKTYKSNYNTQGEVELGDIERFTLQRENIENLPDFDLLTGGFPCQAFSMMGEQKGFDDVRGNVFYTIAKILEVKQPKFLLLENVKNLIKHDEGRTFNTVINTLESVGYKKNNIHYGIFDTNDFGLAQRRNRVFVFASKEDLPLFFNFSKEHVKASFQHLNGESSILRQKTVLDVLSTKVSLKYYLSDKIKPTILADGSKNFQSKSDINQLIARPLTATMVKMHRACQDNYYSDEFLNAPNQTHFANKLFTKEELREHNIRRITPEEALKLQGFNTNFYENAVASNVSDHQLYKQAGNAVSVNTVYAILHYLLINQQLISMNNGNSRTQIQNHFAECGY